MREEVTEKINAQVIESLLSSQCYCKKIECHEEINSTNIRVKQLAEQGEPEGTLVVAETQTAGKGRRGRSWESQQQMGIWMSLLLRPQVKPAEVSCLTLVAAMAVTKAIQKQCNIDAKIKWPNDVVVKGKKLCGILTEMNSEVDVIHSVVVGMGINANHKSFSPELQGKATSIFLETGQKVDRQKLIAEVMEGFSVYYEKYLQTKDMTLLQEEYNALLINKNQEVLVYHGMMEEKKPEEAECGTAKGIDASGALLVETMQGLKKIVSGEVSVRGIYGYV